MIKQDKSRVEDTTRSWSKGWNKGLSIVLDLESRDEERRLYKSNRK